MEVSTRHRGTGLCRPGVTALSVTIVPASTAAAVAGVVDAAPAPANSAAAGTPTTFSIHGIAVSADPAAIITKRERRGGAADAAATATASDDGAPRGRRGRARHLAPPA
jgi:hypothetical protein